MIFMKLALSRQVRPAISDQFATDTLEGDPRHLTKIQDVGQIIPMAFQDPSNDDRRGHRTRCTLYMLEDIGREISAAGWKIFEVQ